MATVNKDFKVKAGLVVEGTTGTINGNNILTENASDQYIIDLIGGETLVTSVDSTQLQVVNGELSVKDNVFDAAGAADTAEGNANDYTDTAISTEVTNRNSAISTAKGEATADANDYTDTAISGLSSVYDALGAADAAEGNANDYTDTAISTEVTNRNSAISTAISDLNLGSTYDAYGAASTVQSNLDDHISDTSTHGVTGDIVGTSDEQDLSNKTFLGQTNFQSGGGAGGTNNYINVNNDGHMTVRSGYELELESQNNINITSNGGDIVLSADGAAYVTSVSAGNQIATNAYVDNAVSGLDWKQAVNLLWDDINASNSGYSGTLVIDGHAALTSANNGYRILVTSGETAGLWDYSDDGDNWTLTRSADADAFGELVGAAVYVMEGTQYGSTSWVQGNHYLSDFTGQLWTQFSGSGSVVAGSGITVDGLEVSIDRTTVDSWYDESGAASQALSDANDYTDTGLSGKQDTLTAGSNIDISGTTISVTGLSSGDISDFNSQAVTATAMSYDAYGAAGTAKTEAISDANDYTDTAISTEVTNRNSAISSAINALTTDDIEQGTTNKYFTDTAAKIAIADLLTNSTQSNIEITGTYMGLTITAENGVADSTTDDLTEGETNLYFTNQRVIDAVDNADITPRTVQIDTFRKEEATQTYFTSASTATVHNFGYPFGSVKYVIRVVGTVAGTLHSQITEILATVDGNNNVAITEFGSIHTTEPALASFTVDHDPTGSFRLRATVANAGSEVIVAATLLSWAD